jgi:hypothetical protein
MVSMFTLSNGLGAFTPKCILGAFPPIFKLGVFRLDATSAPACHPMGTDPGEFDTNLPPPEGDA